MLKKRMVCLMAFLLLLCGCSVGERNQLSADGKDDVVILYTANVDCQGDGGLTYAGVAAYRKEMEKKCSNMILVDAGGFLSGDMMGAFSEGNYPIRLMNEVGYDLAVPGKREMYYDMDELVAMEEEMDFSLVSSNCLSDDGTPVFEPYVIRECGDVRVAFVGVTCPEVYNRRQQEKYEKEDGSQRYDFCSDNDVLIHRGQETINEAREEGADYVILVSNAGKHVYEDMIDMETLIKSLVHVDGVIDGSGRDAYESWIIRNHAGEEVVVGGPGRALEQLGVMTIDNGKLSTTLVQDYRKRDTATSELMSDMVKQYRQYRTDAIAYVDYDLVMRGEQKEYRTRYRETNLGDLCADAYREVMCADVALVDSASINGEVLDQDISYADVESIFPYEQKACLVRATGRELMRALELATSQSPYASRNFLQVSGIRFEVDTDRMPAVVFEDQNTVYLSDNYRVENVQVLDRKLGTYEDLKLDQEYLVAMSHYMYKGLSGSYVMFKDCEVLMDEEMSDTELLMLYLKQFKGEKMPEIYADGDGDGRIVIR